jgi:hypothetical protein
MTKQEKNDCNAALRSEYQRGKLEACETIVRALERIGARSIFWDYRCWCKMAISAIEEAIRESKRK